MTKMREPESGDNSKWKELWVNETEEKKKEGEEREREWCATSLMRSNSLDATS